MCTICNHLLVFGITDIYGVIDRDTTKTKVNSIIAVSSLSLDLEKDSSGIISPALNVEVYDVNDGYKSLFRQSIGVNYCPFCGQELKKGSAE